MERRARTSTLRALPAVAQMVRVRSRLYLVEGVQEGAPGGPPLVHRVPVYKTGYNQPVYSIQTTELFETWFDGLKDRQARARIQSRIDRAEDGNFGDCKPVGEGVSEMRIHHGAGYRVYFRTMGAELVILLAGGSKSTQSSDIRTALKLARRLEA